MWSLADLIAYLMELMNQVPEEFQGFLQQIIEFLQGLGG